MINIMIVEDDPMVRTINEKFTKKLESYNIVCSVGDINEAKEYLEENRVDLILLDVFLPSGNGFELLKWIRKNEIESDIILITAEDRVNSIKEAFRYGVVDYLIKPFSFIRFKEALGKYKDRFEKINENNKFKQELIDKYMVGINDANENSNSYDVVLRKGININTYNQIFAFVKAQEENFTAEFVAEKLGLARVTVRRYLEYMVNENKVELIQVYGKIGRPTHFYKLKI